MLIRHGTVDWPQIAGQEVICPICQLTKSFTEFVSVWWVEKLNREDDDDPHTWGCQLVCTNCATDNSHPNGRKQ